MTPSALSHQPSDTPLMMRNMQYIAIIAGILLTSLVVDAVRSRAQSPEQVGFEIVAQGNTGNVWQVNTTTGQLRLCLPPEGERASPRCGPAAS